MAEMADFRSTRRQWILCFVVCNFNVDVGPEVETIFPPHVPFSQTDISTICFNSFPERHDAEIQDDAYFTFTLKNTSPDINFASPTPPYGSPDLFHGTCVFRQEYDTTSKRSFNQKSLVLLSNQEFPAFFINLLRVVVTASTIGDITRLEAACAQVEGWPPPRLGTQQLPFLGNVFSLDIPLYPSFPLQGLSSAFAAQDSLLNSISAYEPFQHWHFLLPYISSPSLLYILYERALLGLPIIILGQNPQQVCGISHAIIDLIRPLPYAGIRRPYLPLQSTSLGGELSLLDPSNHSSQTSYILGITNPFLLQKISNSSSKDSPTPPTTTPFILALSTYPTHSSISSPQTSTPSLSQPPPTKQNTSKTHRLLSLAKSTTTSLHTPHIHRKQHSSSSSSNTPHSPILPTHHSHRKTTQESIPGSTKLIHQAPPPTYLRTSKSFLAALSALEGTPGNAAATTHLIRRHFTDLTAKLLAPINRFQVAGNGESASKFGEEVVSGQSFPVDQFIRGLGGGDDTGVFRGQGGGLGGLGEGGRVRAREEFYGRFCRSVNFQVWMEVMKLVEEQGAAGMFDDVADGDV